MSIGIYKITNTINNKRYIGQSVHIEKRWKDEIRRSFDSTSSEYNYPRSQALRKYGLENFKFEIIELCALENLNEREIYYINYFNSVVPNGYNLTLGGSNSHGMKLDLTKVEEITEVLKTTNLTNTAIGEIFGVSENTICGINTGYYWKRIDIDYPIRKNRVHTKQDNHVCVQCGAKVSIGKQLCVRCAAEPRRKADRPSKEKLLELVATLGFSAVGRIYGVSDNAIKKWCKSYGLPNKKQEIVNLYKSQNK